MDNGIYAIYYTGIAGTGMGMLVITDGIMAGADIYGGVFNGTYSLNNTQDFFDGSLSFTVPAKVPLVTGAEPRKDPYTFEFPIKLRNKADGLELNRVETPTGPINVSLKLIRKL